MRGFDNMASGGGGGRVGEEGLREAMGPHHDEQTPSFNPKCAVTVGPNCTSHLFTMEELQACMDVSCEASLRGPAVWQMVNNAGLHTLSYSNCTLTCCYLHSI